LRQNDNKKDEETSFFYTTFLKLNKRNEKLLGLTKKQEIRGGFIKRISTGGRKLFSANHYKKIQ